jgi:hypothetical protein
MSHSIHQTIKSVFRNKSKKVIDEMTNTDTIDPDVVQLRKKRAVKIMELESRIMNKIVQP